MASVLGIGNDCLIRPKQRKQLRRKSLRSVSNIFQTYENTLKLSRCSNADGECVLPIENITWKEYNPGEVKLILGQSADHSSSINFWNGYANLNVELPDGAKEGDCLHYKISVNDINQINPIEHDIYVQVTKPIVKSKILGNWRKKNPPSNDSGDDSQSLLKMALPNANAVKEDWESWF